MPDLPPVEERFTADATQYVATLEAMARAAQAAADAAERLRETLAAVHQEMDDAAHAADEAAQAEDAAAEAAGHMAAETVAATGAIHGEAAAVRDLAAAWTEEELAQRAADAAAAAFGRDVARAAGEFEAFMGDRLRASIQNLEHDLYVIGHSSGELDPLASDLGMLRDDLHRLGLSAKTSADDMQTASATVGRAMGVQIGWLRLGVGNWMTFLHWVVAGSAEFLAVAVPAAIALGAGAVVAAQGAQMASFHMQALYNTMEAIGPALHKTAGDVLGLGHSLQTAQNEANPGVYTILGSVINDMKSRFADFAGTGLQVVHMLDEFSARITTDLTSGGMGPQLHALLSGMTQDLQQFGQILGNIGHAILNFAAAMPGLAHVLLDIADGLSRVVEFASRGGIFITMAMGLEEMYRWGGLAAGVLVRVAGLTSIMNAYGTGGFIFRFGAALLTLGQGAGAAIQWLGRMVGAIGPADGALAGLGRAIEQVGFDMKIGAATMSPLMVAASALVVGAMGILAVALDHTRNSAQQLIDKVNQAVQSAPTMTQAMADLAIGSGKAALALQHQEDVFHSYPGYLQASGGAVAGFVTSLEHISGPLGGVVQGMINATSHTNFFTRAIGQAVNDLVPVTSAFHFFSSGATQAASQVDQLRAAENQWAATGARMVGNAQNLASVFHVSLPAAFSMAQQAGVNLMQTMNRGSFAFQVAEQQVRNYITGIGAMGAPTGQIGTDMNALAIQSGNAASKVQQLNQALDQVFGLINGGIGNFAQLDQAVNQMSKDSVSSSARINGAFGSIHNSAAGADAGVKQLQFSLAGIGPKAAQSLQQATQAMQLGQQQADFFQQALSEGAIGINGFDQSIKDIVGVLAPFAQGNKAVAASLDVIAQRAGGPVTTSIKDMLAWAGIRGPQAMKALESATNNAGVGLSHLSAIAQHLGVTMQGQMTAAFSSAVLRALHYNQAMQTLAGTLQKYPADSAQVHAAVARVNQIQSEAASIAQKYGQATKTAGGDAAKAADNWKAYSAATETATQKTSDHVVAMLRAKGASSELAAKDAALTGNLQQNASVTQHASTAAQAAATQVQHLGNVATTTRANVGDVNNEIRTMAGVAGSGESAMARLAASFQTAGSYASNATGQVRGLQGAIAALSSKTITITTVMNTVHRAGGGPVVPGVPFTVGEQGQELFVPSEPGYIIPHSQTQRILAATGGSPQAGGQPIMVMAQGDIHAHLMLDGQEIATAVQPYNLQYAHRNGRQITALS